MTELLIKSLCELLPYKTICKDCETDFVGVLGQVDVGFGIVGIKGTNTTTVGYIPYCKPYLFPLSSMTDELWDKEFRGCGITEYTRDSFKYGCETLEFYDHNPDLSDMIGFINQLIKNHFDIYGLIPKGLAIDATNNNPYK